MTTLFSQKVVQTTPGNRGVRAPSESVSADKAPSAFRTISEVATNLAVPQHVLRFWESKFQQIRPLKRGGGRRYYRPEDIDLLSSIKELLYTQGLTIRGVQKLLKEGGKPQVQNASAQSASSVSALPTEKRREIEGVLVEMKSLRELLRQVGV